MDARAPSKPTVGQDLNAFALWAIYGFFIGLASLYFAQQVVAKPQIYKHFERHECPAKEHK